MVTKPQLTLIRAGELVPLLIQRQGNLQVASANETWQANDQVIYLLHDPRPKLLKRLSGGSSSSRLAVEKLPEVEEIPISEPVEEKAVKEIANKPKGEKEVKVEG